MGAPHEDPGFANAQDYTIAVTVRIRGGARRGTADRRARAVAERLANAAARAKDVVEATATVGETFGGKVHSPRRVHFATANSGQADYRDATKLDRYLDPEHERALVCVAEDNARRRARQEADRRRREAVGCERRPASLVGEPRRCGCIYCQPDDHAVARHLYANSDSVACGPPPCVCGRPIPAGRRCDRHRDAVVVAFADDPDALQQLADDHQEPHR